jgi:hypothetical protein
MSKDVNVSAGVTAFIANLEPDLSALVQQIRQLIVDSDCHVGEQIKWNSPAFFYQGDMKSFNPKEFKRDIVVINTRKGNALLVFPTGAVIDDQTGLLKGAYTDGRRIAIFKNKDDVKARSKALQRVIQQWVKQVDK